MKRERVLELADQASYSLRNRCDDCTVLDFAAMLETELTTDAIEDEEKNPWKHAIMDAAVVHWTLEKDHEHDPRAAVNALICMAANQALDPSISEDARKFITQAKKEALGAELANRQARQTIYLLDLIGAYWDIAYSEGKEGVSRGDEANDMLNKIKEALAAAPEYKPK